MMLMLCNAGWMICEDDVIVVRVNIGRVMISGRRTVSVDMDE